MPTFDSYVQALVLYAQSQAPQPTDTQPGSIYRSIIEALAREMESTWFQSLEAAHGAIHEAAYQLYAFDRRPAQPASGVVTITRTNAGPALTVPAGTLVRVPGTDKVFRTTHTRRTDDGREQTPITSVLVGSRANTAARTIRELVLPISNVAVINETALTSGRDEESDDEREQRFASYLQSLHRATTGSVLYVAQQSVVESGTGLITQWVRDARIIDNTNGYATCHIDVESVYGRYDPDSPYADAQAFDGLRVAVQHAINEYKAAGVTIDVALSAPVRVDVTVNVQMAPTYPYSLVQSTIVTVITNALAALAIGEPLIRERVQAAVLAVPGVRDLVMPLPLANVQPDATQHVIPGAVIVGAIT